MQLKDICAPYVACCDKQITVLAAAWRMREHHTGTLIVVEDPEQNRIPVGIVTDRDIVIEALGKGLDPEKTLVGDIMSRRVVVASADESDADALERMREHGVRRIPVVDDKRKVIGIIAFDDLVKMYAERATALSAVISNEIAGEIRTKGRWG